MGPVFGCLSTALLGSWNRRREGTAISKDVVTSMRPEQFRQLQLQATKQNHGRYKSFTTTLRSTTDAIGARQQFMALDTLLPAIGTDLATVRATIAVSLALTTTCQALIGRRLRSGIRSGCSRWSFRTAAGLVVTVFRKRAVSAAAIGVMRTSSLFCRALSR